MMNRTKIICTAGPSVAGVSKIEALAKNGMSVLRINCSHGNYSQHEKAIADVRAVEKKLGCPISIMVDLQGPKLRIGDLPQAFFLHRDEVWQFSPHEKASAEKKVIPVKIKSFAKAVSVGGRIYLDDGLIDVEVVRKDRENVWVKVIHGGSLHSRKGMNIPQFKGKISAITQKDKEDLIWGLKQGVDIIALSFVREAQDIVTLRKLIQKHHKQNIPLVFAKIEKPEAVLHLGEIIEESDGVLIARGDLGIELQQEKVPVVQKQIIELCRTLKKPNIVATQMLDSMRVNPIPTRAEVSDVANTIFAGADAVLLTGETSSGKHAIEACATMNRIIGEVEAHMSQRSFKGLPSDFALDGYYDNFLFHAMQMADDLMVKAIVMLTKQGHMIKIMSKFHPRRPIFCIAHTQVLARRFNIYWGVFPIKISQIRVEARIAAGLALLKKQKIARSGDRLLFIYRDYQSKDLNLKVVEV